MVSDYYSDYTWLPLPKSPGLEHNAVNDALAALQVMKEMAADVQAVQGANE